MENENENLEKCNIVTCPRNTADYFPVGYCELSSPTYKDIHPTWFMLPYRCIHKAFIEKWSKKNE